MGILLQTGKHLPGMVINKSILGICIIIIYKPASAAQGVCEAEGERDGIGGEWTGTRAALWL